MPAADLVIRGAREHNLRNVDLVIPRNRLVVLTGVSGSGKSSLAFDTVYAEGQRRYVESLSTYARQFLGQMPKPDVDSITGLAPSISIQQKSTSKNPRSTVGTITEVYDYLRVLYARVGQGCCAKCKQPISAQSTDQILEAISLLPAGTKYEILAPLVNQQKGEFRDLFADLLSRATCERASMVKPSISPTTWVSKNTSSTRSKLSSIASSRARGTAPGWRKRLNRRCD
jgi:excinuclease ABC subunit A